ncbi:hypothetical protein ABL78_6390 [Leptomonas seymouri]|uniref:Uncharacterized protein n=1 Tax=Leptomonas seymouri TaxID=5684 RepID=A0A0N0P3U8_LEPSE|nr:hypothetical protein ABL78_6390 [Leptomonas seymouri]|eukprot:KPI84549.1 hypothetical protein ABL78_6390 [Leptomonas seymouri]
MPPIELHSLKSFSAWLHECFVEAVPFGLSLRLRPLISSSGIVSVRPHVGHVLLSLLARDPSESLTGGSTRSGANSSPLGDVALTSRNTPEQRRYPPPRCSSETEGRHSGRSGAAHTRVSADACPSSAGGNPHSYPLLLQSLLQLTRSDATCVSSSATAAVGAAAVDGVGRKLHLLAALLHHCAQWWASGNKTCSSNSTGDRSNNQRGSLPQPFLFFESSVVAVPLPADGTLQLHCAEHLLLRVLRRLSQRGGWRLHTRPPSGGETNEGQDWLDYVVYQAVHCDLQPSGEYRSFLSEPPSTSTSPCSASTARENSLGLEPALSKPFVSVEVVRAVLWHILATEVDGDALVALHRLAENFLCWPAAAAEDSEALSAHCGRRVPLSSVRCALHRLLQNPERAFTCFPPTLSTEVGASSVALLPPVSGPIALSRVLPPEILVIPFSGEYAELAGGDAARPAMTPRFFLRGVRRTSADGDVRRSLLRVLLLRVDPEGGWLPAAEALANCRSFHASFQRQGGGEIPGDTLPTSKGSDDVGEADPDDFALQEAQSAGRRLVINDPSGTSNQAGRSLLQLGDTERSPAEDAIISFLTANVLREAPFAPAMASADAKAQLIWSATVRLYLYTLLHGVRVILTPERLPAFTKSFGYRHLEQLHRTLCNLRGRLTVEMELLREHSSLAAAATALLNSTCAREPPVAIYLVDQLDLQAFARLQEEAGQYRPEGREGPLHPLLPLVLCRDSLRHPVPHSWMPFDAATPAPIPVCANTTISLQQGVFGVSHCCVLDEEVACRTWVQQPSLMDADVLMETCAGLERLSAANKRSLCLVAFAPPRKVLSGGAERKAKPTVGSGVQEYEQRGPTILLVAATHVHAVHYVGLLRKAGLALQDALLHLPTRISYSSGDQGPSGPSSESLCGAVRGGGAFYVAVAKQLRLLLLRLQGAPLTASSTTPSAADCVGVDVPLRERRWVCYVMYLLAEACGAVATQHAEPLIAGGSEANVALPASSRAWTCGPRARRRLWLEVLRGAVESRAPIPFVTTTEPPPRPTLHVQHANIARFSTCLRCLQVCSHDGHSTTEDPSTPYEVAMRWFASPPPWQIHGATCEAGHGGALPLFEPLHTNTRAVREALSLLLLSLSAAV